MSPHARDDITARITGDVSGQVALGSSIRQVQRDTDAPTAPNPNAVRAVLAALRCDIAREAPGDLRDGAVERAEELEQAVLSEEMDVTTIAYVTRWFARRVPDLGRRVAGAFADPAVARMLDGARSGLASELRASLGG